MTKTVWTLRGPKTFFVLFFINIHTRRIELAGITYHPTSAWVLSKIQALNIPAAQKGLLIRDSDRKFGADFDKYFKTRGFEIFRTPYRSPNLNAYAESWVARIKQECLNHFMILGSRHFKYLLQGYLKHYDEERPHGSLGRPPNGPPTFQSAGKLKTHSKVGGLFHHYEWE